MPARFAEPRRAPAGFTVTELIVSVVLVGVLFLIATPRIRDALVRLNVRNARYTVASLYQRARVTAIQTRRPATLHFNGTSAWVTARIGGVDQPIGPVTDLTSRYGVAVNAPAPGTITVTPMGLVILGGDYVVRVSRGGVMDSLVVSPYGRSL